MAEELSDANHLSHPVEGGGWPRCEAAAGGLPGVGEREGRQAQEGEQGRKAESTFHRLSRTEPEEEDASGQ